MTTNEHKPIVSAVMITLLAFSITSGGIAAEDPTMVDAVFDEEADTIVTAPDTWVVAAFT